MKGKYHIAYEAPSWVVRSINPKDTRESVKRRRPFIITRTVEQAMSRLRRRAERMRSL